MSQTITQLQQLTDFLNISLKGAIHTNNIDAWQERGTLIISGEDKGQEGYAVAKWKHTAVIAIEKFPHRKVNPYNLLAMVGAFLIDSEWPRDEYGLDDPEIDIDVVSKDNATVLIDVQLIDDIELIPDENGPVLFNGARYYVSLAPISIAEDVDVNIKGQS
ncbi:phage tail protein [Pseudoalteromonas distincta]|uniref:phage tail protein n=1 Tax=Pseudoalteromonas distincta TaxID=77608 RepID=UPI0039ECF8C6